MCLTFPSGPRLVVLGNLEWQCEGVILSAEGPWLRRDVVKTMQKDDGHPRDPCGRGRAACHASRPKIPRVRCGVRRFLGPLLAVMVVGLAVVGWSFVPMRLEEARPADAELPAASPPFGMSVSALPTAELGSRAALAYRGGSFGEARRFTQTALLVRHPRGDLLFDTGLGEQARAQFAKLPALMQAVTTLKLKTPAARQLRKHGYDVARLAGIVPTHVHWDHISGVPDFSGVPVWLNDVERVFTQSGGRSTALMRSFGKVATRRYAFEPKRYLGFAESLDVWGDGSVVLVPAPGHTPGSILVFLTLPSGTRLVLLGDLVWQSEGITLPAERPWLSRHLVDHDPEQIRAAIAHVAGLHTRFPSLRMLPAHDGRAMDALPIFPASMQ